MIAPPTGVRVWLATGATDMRRGMNSLALQVQETLHRDPHAGDFYVFRGKRGDLCTLCDSLRSWTATLQTSTSPLVPHQYLHPVASLAAPDDHRATERVFGQHVLRQSGKSMGALAEINWPRGQQYACASGTLIMSATPKRAPHATPRSTGRRPCRR